MSVSYLIISHLFIYGALTKNFCNFTGIVKQTNVCVLSLLLTEISCSVASAENLPEL